MYLFGMDSLLRTLASVLMLAFVLARVCAQTDSSGVASRELEGVEVRAVRIGEPVSSSVPMQQMGREDILRFGMTSLADVVKRMAGVSVRDYGGLGGLKTVSVRNLGAHHTAVNYDGVVMSNTQAGQIDIGRFSLDNLSSLSLSVGQGSDPMQSARDYASAAVLSIRTERPLADSVARAFRVRLRGGSFGYASAALRYWERLGERTLLGVDGSYQRTDGIYPFLLDNGATSTHERRHNGDVEAWQGEVNLCHTFADGAEWQTKLYAYDSERGLPGAVILYKDAARERLWDKNVFVQSACSSAPGRKWQWRGRLKYAFGWNRYEDVDVKYPAGRQTDINRQAEYYVSVTLGYRPCRLLSFSLAQDLAVGTLRNNLPDQPDPERYTSLTALTARFDNGRLLVDANVLATWMDDHTHRAADPAPNRRVTPSLSASWRVLPGQALYVRAMAKTSYRVPTFTDMYYLRIGNTNLRPEKAATCGMGVAWQGRVGEMAVQMTADGYVSSVDDKIVVFPTTYVWKMTNYGHVRMAGVDATLAFTLPVARAVELEGMANYSWQRATDRTDAASAVYGSQLPYTPRHSGNASAVLKTPWVELGYALNACGERYSMVQALPEYRMKSYWEHQLTAARTFRLRKAVLRLSACVNNLGGVQYEVIRYYPMPGRNWQVTATLSF